MRTALLLFALLLIGVPGVARADDDFSPQSTAWNGLSTLVTIAREEQIELLTPSRLDVGTLTASDAVLLVYPTRTPSVAGLTGFLRAGGRVAIADDFGRADELLDAYRIERRDPTGTGELRLRGNPSLLVARPTSSHPLVQDVPALVTNHPRVVAHADLRPVFALREDGDAVVLAGAVGDGRLVTMSDPSVLINNMLELRGNRRFAANLVRYLAKGRSGRLWLVTGATPVVGRFGTPGADRPTHALREALAAFAHVTLPPAALRLLALVVAAIVLLAAASALPRRSPYGARALVARDETAGGFFGRVRFFRDRPGELLLPLLAYKFELEAEIVHRMNLKGRTLLRDLVVALRERGVPEPDVQALRGLLVELDELRAKQDHPPAPPKVDAAKLHAAIAIGERVLRRIGRERELRA